MSSFRIRIGNISPSAIQWHFPLWKWGTKTPKTSRSPCTMWTHIIQQCLGPPHAPPQTAARRVQALSHTYAVKSPLVTMAHRKCAPKSTPSRGLIAKPHYLPHPWTRLTYDAKRHLDPIRRFFTMHWTDRQTDQQTDRPTDRQRESLTTIGRAPRPTRPNNNNHHNHNVWQMSVIFSVQCVINYLCQGVYAFTIVPFLSLSVCKHSYEKNLKSISWNSLKLVELWTIVMGRTDQIWGLILLRVAKCQPFRFSIIICCTLLIFTDIRQVARLLFALTEVYVLLSGPSCWCDVVKIQIPL